jgi:hypothetical protein
MLEFAATKAKNNLADSISLCYIVYRFRLSLNTIKNKFTIGGYLE